ncbi:MAG: SHD1 domain-containing protein [Pirellulales bacterium]
MPTPAHPSDVRRRRSLAALLCCAIALPVFAQAAEESRTWTDSTGKYKLEGKFVKVEDGKLHLEQAGGKKMVIPLDKLSAADAKVAKDLAAANPFKESEEDSPFQPAEKTVPGKAGKAGSKNAGSNSVVQPNWNAVKQINPDAAPLDSRATVARNR